MDAITPVNFVKRRACDQCRLRKLACTKEPEGCARCVRENIKCYYSEQKPMGRPRKCHDNGEPQEFVRSRNTAPPMPAIIPEPDGAYEVNHDIDDSVLGFGSSSVQMPVASTTTINNDSLPGFLLGSGEPDEPINFGDLDASLSIDPSLISVGGAAPTFNNNPTASIAIAQCGCLASIYLAMAGLRELPSQVSPALATVRSALNTTQSVLRCPQCGTFTIDLKSSIECFQNVMLLGMILPTIIDGYKRLLDMIDVETNVAIATGATKVFRVEDYGGIYDHKRCHCVSLEPFENLAMHPRAWQQSIRSLVRADVYGHAGVSSGLNGLITEMEHRQRTRHRQVDILREAGIAVDSHYGRPMNDFTEKDALCLRILDGTRQALGGLTIT